MAKVLLAMSGGVDSSVAAHLLLEEGHDVVGVFMRHGAESPLTDTSDCRSTPNTLPIVNGRLDHKQGCCSASDAMDAQRVADQLDIPFYPLDLQQDFSRIVEYFVDEYTRGRTPNPCVACNNWIKFGKLFEFADGIDARYVATGHYARIETGQSDRPMLLRGRDGSKDQSYVLFGVNRTLLRRILLPIGHFEKWRIRQWAAELGFRTADKPDSQEICFVTSGHHGQFVAMRHAGEDTSGEIVTADGRLVGWHAGIENFTIGQRKGLGVALGEPQFVTNIDASTNRIVIGRRADLARSELTAGGVNWLVDRGATRFDCLAQIRYNSRAVHATVECIGDRRIEVEFHEPCFGVAPGQAVVCYDGDRVLCGGWIE